MLNMFERRLPEFAAAAAARLLSEDRQIWRSDWPQRTPFTLLVAVWSCGRRSLLLLLVYGCQAPLTGQSWLGNTAAAAACLPERKREPLTPADWRPTLTIQR